MPFGQKNNLNNKINKPHVPGARVYLRKSMRSVLISSLLVFGLSSCAQNSQEVLLGSKLAQYNKAKTDGYAPEHNQLFASDGPLDKRKSRHFKGSGRFTKPLIKVAEGKTFDGQNGVTLNLVKVSVAQAAKVILGDTMKINYTVDQRVKGTVTIQTTNAVSRDTLLSTFETILLSKGISIIEDADYYKIVPSGQLGNQARRLRRMYRKGKSKSVGVMTAITPLQFVSAQEMARILKPLAPQGAILHIDKARNLLVLSGTKSELDTLQDSIDVFDVNHMKGMSFALVPVKNSDPDEIVRELETVFSNDEAGPAKGVLRFIANKRLNAVLVISPQPAYLRTADTWIKRLDRAGHNTSEQLYVYKIQNRPAAELTSILNQVFLGKAPDSNTTASNSGSVAPRFTSSTRTTGNGEQQEQPQRVQPAVRSNTGSSQKKVKNLRIVTDEANNSLLIMAAPRDYKRILRVLERIDVMPNQVLLEATIAEVTLNDELKYGLRWFFEKGKSNFSLTDAASGLANVAFPGFSYFFSTPKVQVALNALASITDVKIVSSPSVMVLDNKKAVLQVGDQVPIATQSAVSVVDDKAPIVNSVSFKDTGVILSVKPRVNDSGRVLLEIEQEVSDVTQTTTSGIDSPTIQQRKIKTTVVVTDGNSLTLGGLIQNSNNKNKSQVPLAGDIPIIGNLFKQKTDTKKRTELLIIITPRVVRDNREAHSVTDEFRRKLNNSIRNGRPNAEENIRRVFE